MRRHLTYANVMATLAVFGVVAGGGAYAASVAERGSVTSESIRNGSVRSQDVKDDALTGEDVRESGLKEVPKAQEADTVKGLAPTDFTTSSAYAANDGQPVDLGPDFTDAVQAEISTQADGRVLASASAELLAQGPNSESGSCRIVIEDVAGPIFEGRADSPGTVRQLVIAVNFARELPAGDYLVELECRSETGTVELYDASINVFGLGS
jgi:hypothetical protein